MQQCGKSKNQQNNQHGFKSNIKGMDNHTFDCIYQKFASKLNKSMEDLANYMQCTQDYVIPGGYWSCCPRSGLGSPTDGESPAEDMIWCIKGGQ